MGVDEYGELPGDGFFGAMKRKFRPERHVECSSSQARGNAREILYAASAAVLHGLKGAVSGTEKFFGGITILREGSDTGAEGERGRFRLRGQPLADSGDDARSKVLAGFGQDKSEFIAAVSRGRVNRAGMVAQNLPEAHQGAAAGEVSVLILDGFYPALIYNHNPYRAL